MSTPLSSTELVRLSWLTELRRQGDRQCAMVLHDAYGNACALGLLADVAGLAPMQAEKITRQGKGFAPIGALAGLTFKQTDELWRLNDGAFGRRKHTFAEIADVVENWFRK